MIQLRKITWINLETDQKNWKKRLAIMTGKGWIMMDSDRCIELPKEYIYEGSDE